MTVRLKVACWNTAWHASTSHRGVVLSERLLAAAPDIICLPEARHDFMDSGYHVIWSGIDYGYSLRSDRSKVTLWSRQPWEDVDDLGSPSLPPGRFVAATTTSPLGPVRVVGICIPWRHAHVSSGARNRALWEDHETFLDQLPALLRQQRKHGPMVLLGDFNQRLPPRLVPVRLARKLGDALADLRVWTDGIPAGLKHQLVCHIAATRDLAATEVTGLSRHADGIELSDHDGAVVALTRTGTS